MICVYRQKAVMCAVPYHTTQGGAMVMDATIIPLSNTSPKQIGAIILEAFALVRNNVAYPNDIDQRYSKLLEYFSCERRLFAKRVSMAEVLLDGKVIRISFMKANGAAYVPTNETVEIPADAIELGTTLLARLS